VSAEGLLRELRASLDEGGLRGSFLVRDLRSGHELGIDADRVYPIASLVKVPLAAATLERIRRGELDGATQLEIAPGGVTTPGPIGLTRFRHPARVAIDDLLYLSTALSDGVAADVLFGLTPPDCVMRTLEGWGVSGFAVRHLMADLVDTPAERFGADEVDLAHSLAIGAGTAGQGHRVAQLDVTRANAASARAVLELLQALWTPSSIHPTVAAGVRELMAHNVIRHRLTPDFASDAAHWSSKTGTLLNLRHEAGVVEHADGRVFGVVALTESRVPAVLQPEADRADGPGGPSAARPLARSVKIGWERDTRGPPTQRPTQGPIRPAPGGPPPAADPSTPSATAQAGAVTSNSTSAVCTVPAVRPGAVWNCQYRFVCAMTAPGSGAPYAVRSSVVCASDTSVAS
jgi:beta-lactamase class A